MYVKITRIPHILQVKYHMDKAIAMTEVEIAEVGQMFFEQKNWDLFPEVVLKGFNGRPDFIAKRHQLCAAIECKKTLSYPVIEQLTRWRHDRDERIGNKYNTKAFHPSRIYLSLLPVETTNP